MSSQNFLLRYHEIAMKGGNRAWFERCLSSNIIKMINRALNSSGSVEISRVPGRVLLKVKGTEITQAQAVLKHVFGLSSYSLIKKVPTHPQAILEQALQELRIYVHQYGNPKTFRVQTRRSDPALSESSQEMDRIIGAAICREYPSWGVDLKNADLTLGIEIRFDESYIWTEKIPAHGGLPVGTGSPVLSLISGGLDSPVASIQTLRRGSPTQFVHFYGAPFVGEAALHKVEDLVRIVNRYSPDPEPLHVVFFGKIQEKIAWVTPSKIRTVLYRRMMIRIANRLAKKLHAGALVTGESLGQVASQTLENLSVIDSVSELPILRPLITFDKDEIIERAQRWGTFETSLRPALDCCTLFADRHPSLKTPLSWIEKQESKFSVHDLIEEALATIEVR